MPSVHESDASQEDASKDPAEIDTPRAYFSQGQKQNEPNAHQGEMPEDAQEHDASDCATSPDDVIDLGNPRQMLTDG
jgi:hypothetical protein